MKSTINDVAKMAGTSIATVSRVINKTGYVSPPLIEKVMRAIEELEYYPNAVAKSLKSYRTNMLGLLISDITNPFFSSIVRAVEDTVSRKGYTVVLCNTDKDQKKERRYIAQLLGRQIDGLIVSSATSNPENFSSLLDHGFPLVFVNRAPDLTGIDAVLNNNELGGYIATKHLVKLNHKRIALISGPMDINTGYERTAGYLKAITEFGLESPRELMKIGDFGAESGYLAMKELQSLSKPPTAVFIANNMMTLGAIEFLKEAKIAIPDEISVVGFDEFIWMKVVEPRTTTVIQPCYQLGKIAAEHMLKILVNKSSASEKTVLNPTFFRGASTARLTDRLIEERPKMA